MSVLKVIAPVTRCLFLDVFGPVSRRSSSSYASTCSSKENTFGLTLVFVEDQQYQNDKGLSCIKSVPIKHYNSLLINIYISIYMYLLIHSFRSIYLCIDELIIHSFAYFNNICLFIYLLIYFYSCSSPVYDNYRSFLLSSQL